MAEFTLTGLRVLREVAARGSFSGAAMHLGYTQSAVSRQVALTEAAAGTQLFERHARGARTTRAGGVVLRAAAAVVGELERAEDELAALSETVPATLRVGAFSTALTTLVPRAMAAFAAVSPNTRLRLGEGTSSRLLTDVQNARVDLAVVSAPQEHPRGVRLTRLFDDPLLVALARGHPLAARERVSPEELRQERWVAGSANARSTLLGAWVGSAWKPHVAYVARDWPAKLGLVAAGHAVTIVPGLAVASLPVGVAVVRIEHPAAKRVTMLASAASGQPRPQCAEFARTLRETAAELGMQLAATLHDRRAH
jgi:DNA-binding transcriptional LysR family regulator